METNPELLRFYELLIGDEKSRCVGVYENVPIFEPIEAKDSEKCSNGAKA